LRLDTPSPTLVLRPDEPLGILVHGDNHFIVHGPLPDRATALALARHWSVIEVGAKTPAPLAQWQIVSKAFRENLQWAVIVAGDSDMSPAVTQLLAEMVARGIVIHNFTPFSQ
jgi:hypothetical protein